MQNVDVAALSDSLHRLVKLALDSGEVANIEEAEALFATYSLSIYFSRAVARSAAHQAALLTAVNCGRRSMLGGVEVSGALDVPLVVPYPECRSLGDAVRCLGGRVVARLCVAGPLIAIGDCADTCHRRFAVRITFEGWTGGIVPLRSSLSLPERHRLAITGVLAGALAVAEAFQHLRGTNVAAGRRATGLSLWRPELNWLDPASFGPKIEILPSALWLIGLGNLGQAYLWILTLLPYASRRDVNLVLQDFDVVAKSNDSTSMLTDMGIVGRRKARAMAAWANTCGFNATVIERKFAANFRVEPDEPQVALCGVDNSLARAALEDVGFARVIEAGLGKGISDYLALRMHVFPGPKSARELWSETSDADTADLDRPAYKELANAGADKCGLALLAGRTVGAPFVGTVAAAVAIANATRLAIGAHTYALIDAHLRALDHRSVVGTDEPGTPFNPGTSNALPDAEGL